MKPRLGLSEIHYKQLLCHMLVDCFYIVFFEPDMEFENSNIKTETRRLMSFLLIIECKIKIPINYISSSSITFV